MQDGYWNPTFFHWYLTFSLETHWISFLHLNWIAFNYFNPKVNKFHITVGEFLQIAWESRSGSRNWENEGRRGVLVWHLNTLYLLNKQNHQNVLVLHLQEYNCNLIWRHYGANYLINEVYHQKSITRNHRFATLKLWVLVTLNLKTSTLILTLFKNCDNQKYI